MNPKTVKNKKRSQTRRPKATSTPVSVKPDHAVEVKHVQKFSVINLASGYFDAYQNLKPYEILSNSSWSHLLDVYESMRVTRMNVSVWITNASSTTQGATSGFLYRDTIPSTPLRYYEQLIVEPGSQKGRVLKTYNFKWLPIEPVDYNFYDHKQFASMDNGQYGQINFAGAGLADNYRPTCLIEFKVHYEFKSLVKPEAPPSMRKRHDSDSDSSIVTIEQATKPSSRIKRC